MHSLIQCVRLMPLRNDIGKDARSYSFHAKSIKPGQTGVRLEKCLQEILKGLAECLHISVVELAEGMSLDASAIAMRDDVPLGRHFACAKLACYTDGSTEIMNDRIGASLVETYS